MTIKCPRCGNEDLENIRYLEQIVCYREIDRIEDGVIYIHALYETGEGYDEGENPMFECMASPDPDKPWKTCGCEWAADLGNFEEVEWI